MSFVKNSYKVMGGGITEVMSNDDATLLEANGNNMMSSGNTNRFYEPGFYHNMRNLLQLQKQYTEVELQGCNLAVMRGEKLPVIIMDHDKVQAAARSGNFTGSMVQNLLYEMACGWYVIDGIMWKWATNPNSNGTTLWTTKLKLVRREWPIPGKVGILGTTEGDIIKQVTVDTSKNNTSANGMSNMQNNRNSMIDELAGASNYSTDGGTLSDNGSSGSGPYHNALNNGNMGSYIGTSASRAITVPEDDRTTANEVPLSGLRDELKYLYQLIKSRCPNVKIVSARRWAVDESGNRANGNAFVKRNGLYKCANAKGEIMYFKSNNSKHLYGEAFDLVNSSGQDFNSIMTDYVMTDDSIIQAMAKNGIAACIEQTTDDSGVATKHFHFGTDEAIQTNYWDSVLALNKTMSADTLKMVKNASGARKRYASNEIKNTDVDEYRQEN